MLYFSDYYPGARRQYYFEKSSTSVKISLTPRASRITPDPGISVQVFIPPDVACLSPPHNPCVVIFFWQPSLSSSQNFTKKLEKTDMIIVSIQK
jgi:hypothetical protein